jgi:hypothetical protein
MVKSGIQLRVNASQDEQFVLLKMPCVADWDVNRSLSLKFATKNTVEIGAV